MTEQDNRTYEDSIPEIVASLTRDGWGRGWNIKVQRRWRDGRKDSECYGPFATRSEAITELQDLDVWSLA